MTSFSEKSNVFVYSREIPVAATCEVLVVGAGPAGVSAAVSAARAGADVILCERFGVVGGMLTSGHVDPLLGEVSRGTIYDEIVDRLHSRRGDRRESVTHNGREIAYDPEAAKSVLSAMLREAG
ncbi:MAG: FAD-dependent oxidoreductase, partial [Clostridia bacterium]|nr:FAD-dependent oxidoreductase [Clostridia bacterium]